MSEGVVGRGLIGASLFVLLFLPTAAISGESVRYLLGPGSTILQICPECSDPAGRPESLQGSFSLTPFPVADSVHVEALGDVDLRSASYTVAGSGYVQFSETGQMSILLQARINGEDVQLRATRRQPDAADGLVVVVATPRRARVGYLLILKAQPQAQTAPDRDEDGIYDSDDNCIADENPVQQDDDRDAVGNACDACPETEEGAMVNHRGCSPEQSCPCDGPRDGGVWTKGAYGRCMAQAARELRREDQLSRRDAVKLLRDALRSGCGQTVVALR